MVCEICGMTYCGRPCINDPEKRNPDLFHPDGRKKTLKERGLGWDDPPDKARALLAAKPLRKGKGGVAGSLERARAALRVVDPRQPAAPPKPVYSEPKSKPPKSKPAKSKPPKSKPESKPRGEQPWLALGISKQAWYKRRRKERDEND